MERTEAAKYVELFRTVGKLKKVKRAGWGLRGVSNPESVAEHSHRMSVMALMLGEMLGADSLKLSAMCAIHDVAESITGDITPEDGVSAERKRELEESAVREMFMDVPGGEKHVSMWLEYEGGNTKESRAARLLDKLEMALQAAEYAEENSAIDLSEFMDSAAGIIDGTELQILLDVIRQR